MAPPRLSTSAAPAAAPSSASRPSKAPGPVALCICAYRCRKTMADQGKIIPVSTRQAHRKKDLRALAGRVWVTAAQEEMLRDSVLRNQSRSFHILSPSPARAFSSPGSGPSSPSSPSSTVSPGAAPLSSPFSPASPELADCQPGLHPGANHSDVEQSNSAPLASSEAPVEGPAPSVPGIPASLVLSDALSQLQLRNDEQDRNSIDDPALLQHRPPRVSYTDAIAELCEDDEDHTNGGDMADEDMTRAAAEQEADDPPGDSLLDDSYVVGLEVVPGMAQSDDLGGQYGIIPTGFEGRIGPLTVKETEKVDRLQKLHLVERAAAAARAPSMLPFGRGLLIELLKERDAHRIEGSMTAPAPAPPVEPTPSNVLTIDHLTVWEETGGTVDAYNGHGELLARQTKTPVGSLHVAHGLVQAASELSPVTIDMCPASCMAYTGPRSRLSACSFCGLGRYREQLVAGRRVSVKTYQYLPYKPRAAAYYSTKFWAEALRYGVHKMRQAAASFRSHPHGAYECAPDHLFGDVFDGVRSAHLLQDGLFRDERDIAVAISTDGAQLLPHRRSSSAWVVLLQTLSLPPSSRFALKHQHISMVVPGPNSPKDLDSFLWPLYAELADLAVHGARIWDAATESWFRLRVHLLSVYADQPASAKMGHLVGGCGVFGCRCCTMRAVRPKGAGHAAYFPLNAMATDVPLNASRGSYDPHSLPRRTPTQFLDALALLDVVSTSARRKSLVTATGIVDLPAVAFSLAFRPFEFFPLDPFHLFNCNVPKTIWKALIQSLPGEFGLTPEQRSEFGAFIAANAKNYPVVFSSRAPRDISLYANTSYKMVEWGSVFHHFLPAYLHSISAPSPVRTMLDVFVQAVDLAMACDGLRLAQVTRVRELFIEFVQMWERLYVGSDLALPRATISVHLLLHVFDQLLLIGSVRATSQAPCERALGSLKRGLTAFRFPYGVVARRARADTQLMLARLRLGLETDPATGVIQEQLTIPLSSSHRPFPPECAQQEDEQLRSLHAKEGVESLTVRRYGRYVREGLIVRSRRAEGAESRTSSVIVFADGSDLHYARVEHFVVVALPSGLAAYASTNLFRVKERSPTYSIGEWAPDITLISVRSIRAVAAALETGQAVYVVQRSSWQCSLSVDLTE